MPNINTVASTIVGNSKKRDSALLWAGGVFAVALVRGIDTIFDTVIFAKVAHYEPTVGSIVFRFVLVAVLVVAYWVHRRHAKALMEESTALLTDFVATPRPEPVYVDEDADTGAFVLGDFKIVSVTDVEPEEASER